VGNIRMLDITFLNDLFDMGGRLFLRCHHSMRPSTLNFGAQPQTTSYCGYDRHHNGPPARTFLQWPLTSRRRKSNHLRVPATLLTAGIDLALALLEEDYGADAARQVARKMGASPPFRRAVAFSALLELEPKSDRVRTALTYAKCNLYETFSVDELCVDRFRGRLRNRLTKVEAGLRWRLHDTRHQIGAGHLLVSRGNLLAQPEEALARATCQLTISRGRDLAAYDSVFQDVLLPAGLRRDLMANHKRADHRRPVHRAALQKILHITILLRHLRPSD
jgi:hypothetical protein